MMHCEPKQIWELQMMLHSFAGTLNDHQKYYDRYKIKPPIEIISRSLAMRFSETVDYAI